MSLVGPRPLLAQYLDRYTPEQARRTRGETGVTGLALSGRNALSWEEKFAYDVRYVDEPLLQLDLRILLVTVGKVIHREGVSADGHPTFRVHRHGRIWWTSTAVVRPGAG